nr:immunoglobulin light chain junction region [Macaca mulatta]MOV73351.1 immunoglobulin light chain junction region [Macaca mulatta]
DYFCAAWDDSLNSPFF